MAYSDAFERVKNKVFREQRNIYVFIGEGRVMATAQKDALPQSKLMAVYNPIGVDRETMEQYIADDLAWADRNAG